MTVIKTRQKTSRRNSPKQKPGKAVPVPKRGTRLVGHIETPDGYVFITITPSTKHGLYFVAFTDSFRQSPINKAIRRSGLDWAMGLLLRQYKAVPADVKWRTEKRAPLDGVRHPAWDPIAGQFDPSFSVL